MRSAMRAASQLPGKGPTDVDDAPAPAQYYDYDIGTFTLVIVSTISVDVVSGLTFPVSLYPTTSGRTILMDWPNITASASIPPTPRNKMSQFMRSCTGDK